MKLRELFIGYGDGSEDAVINLDRFEQLSKDSRFLSVLDSIPSITTAAELFYALDCTGDGNLDVDEFVRGVNLCKAPPTALDVTNCLLLLRKVREDQVASKRERDTLSGKVDLLTEKVDILLSHLGVSDRKYEI